MRIQTRKLAVLTVVVGLVLQGTASADDKSKNAKLEELFERIGLNETIKEQRGELKTQAEAMRPQIMKQLKDAFPPTAEGFWKRFDAAYAKFVAASEPSWTSEQAVQFYIQEYGKHVTEPELDQILDFYRSPIGQKDIAASRATSPKWTAFLMKKNQEVFEKNYETFVKELTTIVQESAAAHSMPD